MKLGSDGLAHWTFAEGTGNVTYDYARGRRLFGTNEQWTNGPSGSAIKFDSQDSRLTTSKVPYGLPRNESLTLSFYVRGNFSAQSNEQRTILRYQAGGGTFYEVYARNRWNDFGIELWGTDGRTRSFGIESTTFDSWTHIGIVIDRSTGNVRLYRNGSLASSTSLGDTGPIYDGGELRIGPNSRNSTGFEIDELRLYRERLSSDEIAALANESD